MKILVTGHRGLLGSACVRRFSKRHEVLAINTTLFDDRYVRFWFAEHQPDAVVHCAAKVGGVGANREHPVNFLIDNLTIQNIVMQAASDYGVKKFINIGTSCMYPDNAPVPVKETSLLTGPFNPDVAAYAVAKLAGYQLGRAFRDQYGKHFVTAVPCNLYGPGDNYGPSAHVIPALFKRMADCERDQKSLSVWGDGSAVREFLHSDDAASALETVLDRYDGPELINLGTGHSTSIAELVRLMCAITGFSGNVRWDISKPTGVQTKTLDVSKLSALGWAPSLSLFQGLSSTWEDFTTNPCQRYK